MGLAARCWLVVMPVTCWVCSYTDFGWVWVRVELFALVAIWVGYFSLWCGVVRCALLPDC